MISSPRRSLRIKKQKNSRGKTTYRVRGSKSKSERREDSNNGNNKDRGPSIRPIRLRRSPERQPEDRSSRRRDNRSNRRAKQASMQVRNVKEVPGVDQEIALSESDPEGARRGSQSTGVVEDETAGRIAVLKQASMQERKEDEVTGVGREIALRGSMFPDQGGKKGEVGGEIDPHAGDPSTGVIGDGED